MPFCGGAGNECSDFSSFLNVLWILVMGFLLTVGVLLFASGWIPTLGN